MKPTAWFALPALLCLSCVLAVPSPAPPNQRPLRQTQSSPPSRWQSFSDRILRPLLGSERPHERPRCHREKTGKAAPFPSAHTLAQYGGDLVLRFNISKAEEAASLAEAADTLLLDVWEYSHNWVDIRLSQDVLPSLLGLLPKDLRNAHVPLMRERELAQAIHDTYPTPLGQHRYEHEKGAAPPSHLPERRPFSPALEVGAGIEDNLFFSEYQPLSVIEPWMRLLASLFTTHVRLIDIGLSSEGRNIQALRVGVHPTNGDDPSPPKRKTVLIVGGLHAREWISTTTVNYIAYSLITGYGKLMGVTRLLEGFDFVFIPTLNPDGYVYTWETDRLWRKNRQRTNIRFCQGIDLDHAFGFEWETQGNPCSESFAGETPFEAVEAKRLADWATNETENNNVEFVGFLDLHSYSQEILYPYSYSCKAPPPGLENLEELAFGLGKAIRTTHNHYYEVLPACEGNVLAQSAAAATKHRSSSTSSSPMPHIEASGGSALDFFYHNLKTRFAYQIKLRDLGTYGFLLPKEHIIPTGKEILSSIMYFGEFLSELYDADAVVGKTPVVTDMMQEEEEEGEEKEAAEAEAESGKLEAAAEVDDDYEEDDGWLMVEDLEYEQDIHWGLRRRRR